MTKHLQLLLPPNEGGTASLFEPVLKRYSHIPQACLLDTRTRKPQLFLLTATKSPDSNLFLAVQIESMNINGHKDPFYAFSQPFAEGRMDMFHLRPDADFALGWIDALFRSGSLQTTVEAQASNEWALRHLFFEARNRERLGGSKSLVFGFPLFAVRDEQGRPASQPLFFWNINMEASPNVSESWVLSHDAEAGFSLNPVLAAWLERQCGPALSARYTGITAQRKPSGSEMVLLALELARETGLHVPVDNLTIMPCPGDAELEAAACLDNGSLIWSGLLGLLPEAAYNSGEAVLPAQQALPVEGHPFSLLPLDPWQATAMQQVERSRITVAAGISGTGKTNLIANVIINALANGRKCLMVCSRLSELKEAQAVLGRCGLTTQQLLIRNVQSDQAAVLGLLRSAVSAPPIVEAFPADRYKLLLEKALRLKDKLDAGYHATRRPVFGTHNWTETVGLFLRSQSRAGKELLGQQLYNQDFAFTFEEYEVLRRGIAQSQVLFPSINTLKHPLSALKGELFTQKDKDGGLAYIRQQIAAFSERSARLHHRYISTLNGYSDKLNDLYQGSRQQLNEAIFRLKGMLTDYGNQWGADFENSSEGGLKLSRIVSARAQQILTAREQVREAFAELERIWTARPLFDFAVLPEKDRKSMAKIRANVLEMEASFGLWNEQLPAQIQEEVQRLSSKSVHADLPYTTIVTELEQGLDSLLNDVNLAGILEQPLEHQALTLTKRLKYLEEVMESFDNIGLYLKDYDTFYEWQRHWIGMPENGRKIVRALAKAKPNDWTAALDSWYFNNCLTMQFSPDLPVSDEAVEELAETMAGLQPLLLSRLRTLWDERREAAAKELRRGGRKTSQALSGTADAGVDLPGLFRESGRHITDIFPIVLAPPAVAQALFDADTGFDVVIVDEAQAVPAAEAAPLLHLGRRALAVGDPAQQPERDDASLLGLFRAAGYRILPLGIIHQLKPGNLLQSAWKVAVADEAPRGFELQLTHTHGFYYEHSGINEKEAEAALQLLNRIQPTPQRTMPSVGIVCATPQQRDLISYYLLRIKQRNEPGADVVQQLERNGLGVFHLGELPGLHFDEMILSATFGPSAPNGKVSGHIEMLNGPDQTAQLAALMSRASTKVHALCSIDDIDLQRMAGDTSRRGECLLANYLLFLSAFRQSKAKEQRSIIERVAALVRKGEHAQEVSVFHQEVAAVLTSYIGKDRMSPGDGWGAAHLPLLVSDAEMRRPVAALRADGSFYDTPETDWLWEYEIRKHLKDKNIEYISVWSAAWWRDAKEEARKLAGAVLKA